jgi:hypothetical protein
MTPVQPRSILLPWGRARLFVARMLTVHDNGYVSDDLWNTRQAAAYLGVSARRGTTTLSDLGVDPVDLAVEICARSRRGEDIRELVTPVRGGLQNWYRSDDVRKAHASRPRPGPKVIRLDTRRYTPEEILAAFPGSRQTWGGRGKRIKLDEFGPVYVCTAPGPHHGKVCMPGNFAEQADSIAAVIAARVDQPRRRP